MGGFLSLLVHAGRHPGGGDAHWPRSPGGGRPQPHPGHGPGGAECAAWPGGRAVLTRDAEDRELLVGVKPHTQN